MTTRLHSAAWTTRVLVTIPLVLALLGLSAATEAHATRSPIRPGGRNAVGSIGLSDYADSVVDQTHGHVFVTGGPTDSTIAVLDMSGTLVTSITDESHSGDMALSPAFPGIP